MELWLHNNLNCGGENVYVEIRQGNISCVTGNKVDFDRGTLLSWTGSALNGTCLGKYFNVDQEHLDFKIRSTSGDDFCPKSLTISMDNGYSYERTGMDDWVDKYSYYNRTATRVGESLTLMYFTKNLYRCI